MTMVPVSSSNLASVGYDINTQTLRVSFIGGGLYDYHQVPTHHHQGLMSAISKGEYLDTYIKKGGYRFTKLR
ncbi:KTSC domain-containing protein [Solibacillus sp. CAU 1738]|uniref:KTSC domain-containing protein n=1 Tax=Solibacillus sp. CAU 1738 TaxID=3140363 RepID=UPI003261BD4E